MDTAQVSIFESSAQSLKERTLYAPACLKQIGGYRGRIKEPDARFNARNRGDWERWMADNEFLFLCAMQKHDLFDFLIGKAIIENTCAGTENRFASSRRVSKSNAGSKVSGAG